MVAGKPTAELSQRQESQIGNRIEVFIGQLSLGAIVFIYTDDVIPPKHEKHTEQFFKYPKLTGLTFFLANNLLHPKTGTLIAPYTELRPHTHDILIHAYKSRRCLQH